MNSRQVVFLLVVLALVAGCGPAESNTPEPELSVDECFRSATVEVYADLDDDGARGADEPPLAGIQVGILSQGDEVELYQEGVTDADGRAKLGFITTAEDCNDDYLIGVLVAPAGYNFPERPLLRFGDVWDSGKLAQFGLLPEETNGE